MRVKRKGKSKRTPLTALKERIKNRQLAEEDWAILEGLTDTVERLSLALEEKDASLGKLAKQLLGAPTETQLNVLRKERPPTPQETPEKQKRKGHGRNGAAAYTGGARVTLDHPTLKPEDHCPGCEQGKLYELAQPAIFVQVVGDAPLKATVYERTRLRCHLCGEVFTPELPAEVGEQKYTDSATAMLALLKYGCGLPLHRLERLQGNLGQPLPSSTQWDLLYAASLILAPAYEALIDKAAQGELIHNDDTTMKILSYLKDPERERQGIFTTGLVSHWQNHQIALFRTGDQHAGENLNDLLQRRATGLAPPIQMCDALSRNVSQDFQTILSNCLVHARRQFVEIVDRFPEECTYVIEQLGKVYHLEALIQEEGLSPGDRLLRHQTYSQPVMDDLEAWARKQFAENLVEPNSGLGKAIKYLLKHWTKLTCFLRVPGAPLDNNLCERVLKHAILNRKNALFYKTQRGAQVGDLFMSLIHTCQLAGVNPLDYLTWLLKNGRDLEQSPDAYLPWNYGVATS
jgi:transposase